MFYPYLLQLLMTSTPIPPVPPPPPAAPSGSLTSLTSSLNTSCCENGRPIITDPHTGQSVCSCQYGSGLLSAYSRVPGIGESMYTSPHYPTQSYMPLNTDSSAFYSPLVSAFIIVCPCCCSKFQCILTTIQAIGLVGHRL